MTRSQIEEEYDPMSPLQISIDAMVAQLHELLNDADQTNDPNANVRVWAVREVLAAYLVTSDQIDGPIELWAEVARRSPDFTTAAAASVGEPLCQCEAMGVPTSYHNWRCPNFYVDDEQLVLPATAAEARVRGLTVQYETCRGNLAQASQTIAAVRALADSRAAGDNGLIVVKELRKALGDGDE